MDQASAVVAISVVVLAAAVVVLLEVQVVAEEATSVEAMVDEAEALKSCVEATARTATEATDGVIRMQRLALLLSRSEATGRCSRKLSSQDSASYVWKLTQTNLMRWLSMVSCANMTSPMTEFLQDNLYPFKSSTEFITILLLPMILLFKRFVKSNYPRQVF